MEWTSEKPTKPGRYVLRCHGTGAMILVHVEGNHVIPLEHEMERFTFRECHDNDRWLGPLDEQERQP